MLKLVEAKGFVLDMDGVLYRGDEPLPGLVEFVALCRRHRIPFVFVTNNSMRTPEQYVTKLADMGADVAADRIITSGTSVVEYLVERFPRGTRLYIVGMPALHDVLINEATGYILDPARADLVVTGSDLTLTYEKLKLATLAIRRGATWVATNPDTTLPVEDGLWPGAGAIIAALRASTDAAPTVVGKPEPVMMAQALRRMGVAAADAIMVGDRLDTDILGGIRAGMTTALVMTGVETPETVAAQSIAADYTLHNLAELVQRVWGVTSNA